jgi:hypothetical protein
MYFGSSEQPNPESRRAARDRESVLFIMINEPFPHVDFTSLLVPWPMTVLVEVYTAESV